GRRASELDLQVQALALARHGQGSLGSCLRPAHLVAEAARVADRGAVELQDHVARAQPGLARRAVVVHLGDQDPALLAQLEVARELPRDLLVLDPELPRPAALA